jgi:general secretion pathway protein I
MKNSLGFTLIEVLVALAIIGIALTAVIKATSQNIKDTQYLQQKIIANWVATSVMNEARAGLINLSKTDEISDETDMLNQSWIWKASLEDTPNPNIKSLHVTVFRKDSDQELANLSSYLYEQK